MNITPALTLLALVLLGGCATTTGSSPAAGTGAADGPLAKPAVGPAPTQTGGTVRHGSPLAYSAPALTGDYAAYPAAHALVERLVREQQFDRGYLYDLLSRVERQDWILEFMNRPKPAPRPGPTGAWTRYRAKFLTEERVGRGLDFWDRHAADLGRASERYGVPPEYIVAIIGVETHYGANVGKHRVIDALATLAFDYPRRADFFGRELETFLVMARNEGFDPFAPVGSYAGAMGLGQFMPSSFQAYAVDFDGNGRRDLWEPVDAIGSVANYFRSHGWRSGERVAVPASVRGGEPVSIETGYTTRYRPETLARNGVMVPSPVQQGGEVSLLRLDAAGRYEYWLGLPNFYVITRYNQSTYYAMAVHQLAQAVGERRAGAPATVASAADAQPVVSGRGTPQRRRAETL
jgi:membrane-bound lytic murein transglycosylase B